MKDYSCVQIAIGDICKYDYKQLRYFVFCAFGLDYANRLNSEEICKKLRLTRIMHFTEFFRRYFGIDIRKWTPERDAWQNVVEGLEMKKDILLGFDCYYAPWSPSYQQTHMLHFCQVKGIDAAGNLICTDSYMDAFDVPFEKKELEKAYKSGYYVTAGSVQKGMKAKEILLAIKNAVSIDVIELNYKNLSADLMGIKNYEDIFETDNPEACEIIIIAKNISKNYSECADIMKEWHEEIAADKVTALRENYQHLSDTWDMITQLLLYMFLRKKIIQESMDSIRRHLEENFIYEREVLKLIDSIVA